MGNLCGCPVGATKPAPAESQQQHQPQPKPDRKADNAGNAGLQSSNVQARDISSARNRPQDGTVNVLQDSILPVLQQDRRPQAIVTTAIQQSEAVPAQPDNSSCQAIQYKGTTPGAISIKVAPAPPPAEYPRLRAAVIAAQKEVKAGAKLRFAEHYKLGKVVGTGHHARVQLATCVKGEQTYAVKIIKKKEGKEALLLQLQDIVKEIAVMRVLQGHPNMVELHQVLQDSNSFFLVMEYCNSGELFDQIIRSGNMTEAVAAAKAQQLISFLVYAHSKHVIHRDIKPENLLLTRTEGPDRTGALTLKVVDFGCSTFCVAAKRLCKKIGTPFYVAPEVLWRDYDQKADIWSAGVVLYILMTGRPPFNGRNDEEILSKVRKGQYRMCPSDWNHVTEAGRDLVKQMLTLDATARPSADKLLQHLWFKQMLLPNSRSSLDITAAAAVADAAAADEFDGAAAASRNLSHVVAGLEAFAGMSRMKRLALVVLCHTVTDRHIMRLKEAFCQLDKDGDGHLNAAELHAALKTTGSLATAGLAADIDQDALQDLIAASDLYGEGYVDVDEFLAAMLANSNYTRSRTALRRSFEALDQDHDGFITSADLVSLQQHLQSQHSMTSQLAEELMSEVSSCISDQHEGKMDYQEFVHMMTDAPSQYTGKRLSLDIQQQQGIGRTTSLDSAHSFGIDMQHQLSSASSYNVDIQQQPLNSANSYDLGTPQHQDTGRTSTSSLDKQQQQLNSASGCSLGAQGEQQQQQQQQQQHSVDVNQQQQQRGAGEEFEGDKKYTQQQQQATVKQPDIGQHQQQQQQCGQENAFT